MTGVCSMEKVQSQIREDWIRSESYDGWIIKGYGYERNNEYIEPNAGDLNAFILHFRAGAQSDSE